jgi:hypothetical protein
VTRALGVMGLPVPVAADDLRAYQTGALRDGGLWEALRRVGDHDHSGGQAGAPVAGAGGITQAEADLRYEPIDTMYTKAESDLRYALASALTALTTRVTTLEAQVATLQGQMTGHTHTSGTIDAMGGTAVMP